jgi:hypothetical protein
MHIVVTLVERDFIYGACTLFNSLTNSGFEGTFVIGYRDREGMPTKALEALSKGAKGKVEWRQQETPMHFGNYKPWFMQSVLDQYPQAGKVTYMDPDIVCLAPFDWIDSWSDGGPAVCADVNWMMPADHPTRHAWLEISGCHPKRQLNEYFNSGFLSVRREDAGFLQLWSGLIKRVGANDNPLEGKGDIAAWRKGGRWMPFLSPNQDTLNLALMVWEGQVTTFGPDAMGFNATGFLPHALGSDKPWRKKYFRNALAGRPPTQADKAFWRYTSFPTRPFSKSRIFFTRLAISISVAVGRFYRRS